MQPAPSGISRSPAALSPLQIDTQADQPEIGTQLKLDLAFYEQLRGNQNILIRGFPLSDTRNLDLALTAIRPLSNTVQIVTNQQDENGHWYQTPQPQPDCQTFGGSVVGAADSSVFLGLSPYGCHGWIALDQEVYVISSGPYQEANANPIIFNLTKTDPELLDLSSFSCTVLDVPGRPTIANKRATTKATPRSSGASCRTVDLAIETDAEFTDLFSNDPSAATAYVMTMTAAKTFIFSRDVNVEFQIEFLRLWPDDDIWTASEAGSQLTEFQSHWTSQMEDEHPHLAHFLSPRNLGGGVAWLGTVCNDTYGFALSGNLAGYFPLPVENNHNENWDIVVYAHETGHNLGTAHTHDYTPQIDNCTNGDCDTASDGTIMSYCHICPGGISNMQLRFHPTVQNTMTAYLDGLDTNSCLIGGSETAANDDYVQTNQVDAITIDVLANDNGANCADVSILDFDNTSSSGASITALAVDDETHLRYWPLFESTVSNDSFQYTLMADDGSTDTATVNVNILVPRMPENPIYIEQGVLASYYQVGEIEVLPDFDTLNSFAQEVVPTINLAGTPDAFGGSGMIDVVGALYTGYVDVPVSDTYTFFTESDDGSALYIGDQLVVDNDGLHAMQVASGQIALNAGRHAIRVEFFERYGNAGLVVSFSGGGLTDQVINETHWFHPIAPAPGDANNDGQVDTNDFTLLLIHWGNCTSDVECIADFDLNGAVDLEDFSLLLINFGQ